MHHHSERVTWYSRPNSSPASIEIASELQAVAPGLEVWAKPKNSADTSNAIQVPRPSSVSRNRMPRLMISSVMPGTTAVSRNRVHSGA